MSGNPTKCDVFFKVDVNAVKGGLIAKIGFDGWATLTAIASFMNERGECYPTQETLAEVLGVTRQTVNGKVKKLLDFVLDDGSALMTRKFVGSGLAKVSFYTINPNVGVFMGNAEIRHSKVNDALLCGVKADGHKEEPSKEEPLKKNDLTVTPTITSKDVIHYFCKRYEERYGVRYVPNYARDGALVKNKLLKNYDGETLQAIIDVVIDEYDNRWKKGQYPRPTIGQLGSWLANEALAVVEENRKQDAETEEAIADGSHYFDGDFENKLLGMLGGASQNEEIE